MSGQIPEFRALPQDFGAKVDPMRQMLVQMKTVIQGEISRNVEIDETQDFSALIKSHISEPGQTCQYKAIDKEELEAIWDKIDNWEQNLSGTGKGLAPKEITVLSEIALAFEKNEFALQQGDKIIVGGDEQSSVYNDLVEDHAPIFKAQNLANKQFIGRDENNEVVVSDTNNARGVYDIYSEDDPNRNFKGAFDENAFRPEEQKGLDPSRVQRVNLSNEFLQGTAAFKASYSSFPLYPTSESPHEKANTAHIPTSMRKVTNLAQAATLFSTTLAKAWGKAQEILRLGETQKSREARIEKDQIKKNTKKLDKKHERILHEVDAFNERIRHLEDPSSLPGKDV